MSSEAIDEVKNEEAPEPIANEIIETTNEEQPNEQIKEETKEEPKGSQDFHLQQPARIRKLQK